MEDEASDEKARREKLVPKIVAKKGAARVFFALATSAVAPPVNQNETSLARSTVKLNRKLTGQSGP